MLVADVARRTLQMNVDPAAPIEAKGFCQGGIFWRELRGRGEFASIGNCSRVIHEYRRGDESNSEDGERDESQAGPEGVHGTSPLCTSVGAVCGGVNALRHAPCGDFRVLRG